MEYFLGIVHASEVNAEAFTEHLLSFLNNKGTSLHEIRFRLCDGAKTMPGEKSGVLKWFF